MESVQLSDDVGTGAGQPIVPSSTPHASVPADRPASEAGAGRVLFGASFLLFLVAGVTLNSVGVFIEPVRASFSLASSTALMLPSLFLVGVYGIGPVVGLLLDRFDVRAIVATGVVTAGAGYIGAGLAQGFWPLMCGLAVAGIGAGGCTFVPAVTLANRWFARNMGFAMGVIIGASAVGAALFPPVLAHLVTLFGWRSVLIGSGMLILALAFPIALVTLRDGPHGRDGVDGKQPFSTHKGDGWRFSCVTLFVGLAQFSVAGAYFSFVPFAMELGHSLDDSGLLIGVMNLCSALGCLVMGPLSDRWGARRVLGVAITLNGALMALPLWIAPGPWFPVSMGSFVIGWGMVQGAPTQLGPVLLADAVDSAALARLTGTMLLLLGLFSAAGPIMAGVVHDHAGGYVPALLACGIASLLAVPLLPATRRAAANPNS